MAPGRSEFLNGQVTNELADLLPGEGHYAAFLTNKGKMLGDLRILAVGTDPAGPPTELLLDTERIALQALFDMIRRYTIGYEVELHKRTRGVRTVLADRAGCAHRSWAEPAPRYRARPRARGDRGAPVRLIATADGIDVLFETIYIDAVRAALIDAGAHPVSETAAEIVRVERGRPRYGVDIDESTIPQEAGLNERAVSFTKGCYVGQETVARLYYRGKPNRHLRGLRLIATAQSVAEPPPVASGDELRLGERAVGHAGSVAHSPRLGTIATGARAPRGRAGRHRRCRRARRARRAPRAAVRALSKAAPPRFRRRRGAPRRAGARAGACGSQPSEP